MNNELDVCIYSPQEAKEHRRRFYITQFFLGMFTASTLYASAFLIEMGLSSAQVGFFSAIRSTFGIVTPLLWGIAADRFRTVKKVFFVCLMGVVLFYPTLPLTRMISLGAITLAPVMTVWVHFFYRPLDSIYTGWLVQMLKHIPGMEYGKLRVFSSIASALTGTAFALLIKRYGTVSISYYVGGMAAVALMFAIRPLPDVVSERGEKGEGIKGLQLGRLVRSPLLSLLLLMTFAHIPSCSSSMCIPYLLKVIGADTSFLAWFNATRPLCAIPMMFFSGKVVRRFGAKRTLMFSVLVTALGELMFSVAGSTFAILSIGLMLGLNSGLMIVGQVMYAQELAPPELHSTAQMINHTALALAAIIASVLVGSLIATDGTGVRAYYMVTTALVALSVPLFAFINRLMIKPRQKFAA